MPRKPHAIELTQVVEWNSGRIERKQDYLAAEEPLEIRIGGHPLTVAMRTPGQDSELAAGFLFTEGLISTSDDILKLTPAEELTGGDPRTAVRGNSILVELAATASFDPEKMRRNFFAASSCGICGKASIDAIRSRTLRAPNPDFRVDPELLTRVPDSVRAAQAIFGRTGGLHAAALIDQNGNVLVLREDIGRHNAVDKVIGWALLKNCVPLHETILFVSGRGGFEIVQKAIAAGVSVVACVSAPSSLAVQLARELQLTLVGFLRDRRFVIYAGEDRVVRAVPRLASEG
ncbi:MAG TPA: formate dehydrogenase accessory sulfurtransferase FdhD [Candidatus Acidoferrum sp.]|nr:formate dehydrogenase accessory sulfurtransferase FdhD [Candidatus Acidoferrum sp.]